MSRVSSRASSRADCVSPNVYHRVEVDEPNGPVTHVNTGSVYCLLMNCVCIDTGCRQMHIDVNLLSLMSLV